tara:strand:+ start:293 stop:487 length:195 start_codon:yes stop_codon:yes gene_type:complete
VGGGLERFSGEQEAGAQVQALEKPQVQALEKPQVQALEKSLFFGDADALFEHHFPIDCLLFYFF